MSNWAYRNCPDCNKRVHINFKCKCGGNPWNIKNKKNRSLLTIYILPEEKEKIKRFCKHYGFTMSAFIRKLVLKKIKESNKID